MNRFLIICVLFLAVETSTQAQVPYTINPYSGDLRNSALTLTSSAGDLVAGHFTGTSLQLVNIIFSVESDGITGWQDFLLSGDITVYPNPFRSVIHVDTRLQGIDHVRIYSPMGRIVYDRAFSTPDLNLSGLAAGVYLLKFFDESRQEITSFRVIKH